MAKDDKEEWFDQYTGRTGESLKKIRESKDGLFRCPCCMAFTLREAAAYEICDCGWEDDGQDDPRASEIWGGPNADYSLQEARENFKKYGKMYRQGKNSKK